MSNKGKDVAEKASVRFAVKERGHEMKKIWTLLLVIVMLAVLTGCDSADYQKAVSLYESGEYAEAMALFEQLGEYQDAADRATDCNYRIATALQEAGKYQEAMEIFEALGDYEDCVERNIDCVCLLAEEYAQSGKMTEATRLLSGYYSDEKAQAAFFVIFVNEVTNVYLENFQAALDSWTEYLPIWLKALQANGNKTAVGQAVDIPKVDQSAPQIIALQRSMDKANKSVAKLREAYGEEILQVCDEDVQNLIDTFFTSADTIDQQFQALDTWAVSLVFYGLQENNAGKANNKVMAALYAIEDVAEELVEKYS